MYLRTQGSVASDYTYNYPLYHGIDFRVTYTGVPNLSLTLNNNVSFARIDGDDDPLTVNTGFYQLDVPDNETEGFFMLYNALSATYSLTSAASVTAQIANRWGNVYSRYEDNTRSADTLDVLGVYVGGTYRFSDTVSLRGGFDLRMDLYTHLAKDVDSTAGITQWGIPLGLKVVL